MSATGVEIRTCPNGRTVFQFLYDGAPDACAGNGLPENPSKPGFGAIPAGGIIDTWLKANPVDWLTGLAPQPNDPAITPVVEEAPEKEECACKKGRKDGPQLILLLLTLLWLTA